MLSLYDDPIYEGVQTSCVLTALEAAVKIQKRKVLVGPHDSVGVMLYNVVRTSLPCLRATFLFAQEKRNAPLEGTELKRGCFVQQRIAPVSADTIIDLKELVNGAAYIYIQKTCYEMIAEARRQPKLLREMFPPVDKKVPMGDVFTSCNWVMRDGCDETRRWCCCRSTRCTVHQRPRPSASFSLPTTTIPTLALDTNALL
jgi:ATP-dependent DNA helicase 2 subunit 1